MEAMAVTAPPTRQTFSFCLTPLFFGKWDGDKAAYCPKMCTIKWGFVLVGLIPPPKLARNRKLMYVRGFH